MSLALIAGRGDLPALVADAQAETPLICAYEGVEVKGLSAGLSFRIETLGSLLRKLKEQGVSEVCFCGGIDRPQIDPSKLDAETLPLVPIFQKALAAGDNGALVVVKEIFEEQGFKVRGADTLRADLLAEDGVLGAHQPDAQMQQDAARGAEVLAGLAALDIGQACVIGRRQVLGVETIGGTDHLMATLPESSPNARAILCKGPKQNQIREIDLPTIGVDTIRAAHAAGLAGIVIDAGDVLVLDRAACVQLADDLGLVLWSRGRK
jgi:UDP-2,3-diacylglucosamine hydrolase